MTLECKEALYKEKVSAEQDVLAAPSSDTGRRPAYT